MLAKWKISLVLIATLAIIIIYLEIGPSEMKTIGIARWADSPDYSGNIQGFKAGLQTMGFVEGKNVAFIIESAYADEGQQKEIIKEFKDKRVDMIYSLTTQGTLIVKEESRDIPIVFSIVLYPVEAGLIKNLFSSENNLVGTSDHISIEQQFLFYSSLVSIKKIAFVHRQGELNSQIQLQELEEYSSKNNMSVVDIAATNFEDLKKKIVGSINDVDATYQSCDTLIQNGGEEIVIGVAMSHKKPSFSCNKSGVAKGALAADAVDLYNIGFESGKKAGFILQGIKPGALISDEGNEKKLVNSTTAQNLGLPISSYQLYQTEGLTR